MKKTLNSFTQHNVTQLLGRKLKIRKSVILDSKLKDHLEESVRPCNGELGHYVE